MQALFLFIINVLRIDGASLITRISACYLHGSVVHPREEGPVDFVAENRGSRRPAAWSNKFVLHLCQDLQGEIISEKEIAGP